ncbi:MAG: YihY/virulence factor BrkB family protein, partial [Tsuneonella sp.]
MSELQLPEPHERAVHTLSPEERRLDAIAHRPGFRTRVASRLGIGTRAMEIVKRIAVGAYSDGFIHAGNLAYMAIISIFPFFILGAAIFSFIGEEGERAASINAVLYALPPIVGNVIEPVARSVIEERSGWVLWLGGIVALWTVSSLIETIRDVL